MLKSDSKGAKPPSQGGFFTHFIRSFFITLLIIFCCLSLIFGFELAYRRINHSLTGSDEIAFFKS